MINQDQLEFIVLKELRDFNLSVGWIDPDEYNTYEEYESNYNLQHFELTEYASVYISKDINSSSPNEVRLDMPVNIVVDEFTAYEDWEEYRHEFTLPSMQCLEDIKSFTLTFREAIQESYKVLRINNIKSKIRMPNMGDDKVLEMEGAEYVDLRFYLDSWDYEILSINK